MIISFERMLGVKMSGGGSKWAAAALNGRRGVEKGDGGGRTCKSS
jgi:hypothetical protein